VIRRSRWAVEWGESVQADFRKFWDVKVEESALSDSIRVNDAWWEPILEAWTYRVEARESCKDGLTIPSCWRVSSQSRSTPNGTRFASHCRAISSWSDRGEFADPAKGAGLPALETSGVASRLSKPLFNRCGVRFEAAQGRSRAISSSLARRSRVIEGSVQSMFSLVKVNSGRSHRAYGQPRTWCRRPSSEKHWTYCWKRSMSLFWNP